MAKNKTLMYVGIGLGVLVVGGVAYSLIKGRKDQQQYGGGGNTYDGGAGTGSGTGVGEKTTGGQILNTIVTSGILDNLFGGGNKKDDTDGSGASNNTIANVPDSVPFANRQEGNEFREWVNDNYPDYAEQIDLDREGSHTNTYITRAYEKYGAEYDRKKNRFNKLLGGIATFFGGNQG